MTLIESIVGFNNCKLLIFIYMEFCYYFHFNGFYSFPNLTIQSSPTDAIR